MSWLWIGLAFGIGLVLGLWIAAELGRIVYNRKMDEIREGLLKVKASAASLPAERAERVFDTQPGSSPTPPRSL